MTISNCHIAEGPREAWRALTAVAIDTINTSTAIMTRKRCLVTLIYVCLTMDSYKQI